MELKSQIQQQIVDELDNPVHGLLNLAPRIGKTKIGINIIQKELCNSVLWVTPNVKLRDEDLPEEFKNWDSQVSNVGSLLDITDVICYSSLEDHEGTYDKIVLDEYQDLTPANSKGLFNGNIKYKSILGLSGTHPRIKEKLDLYKKLKLRILKSISIDTAVDMGLIAPYNITVINTELDKISKNVKGYGFMTTEFGQYNYYTKLVNKDNLIGVLHADFENLKLDVGSNIGYQLIKFKPKFECLSAYVIVDKNSSLGYLVVKDNGIRGKLEFNKTEYRIVDKDLIFNADKWLLLSRMRLIYNLTSKNKFAVDFVSKLSGRTLVFSGSIEQAERISKNTYHSKTDDVNLKKFLNKEIDILSCVNAGGTGFTYEGVDNFVIVQVNSNRKGDITQKICRSLMQQTDYTASIYILCVKDTVDEIWKDRVLESFNQNRIVTKDWSEFKSPTWIKSLDEIV